MHLDSKQEGDADLVRAGADLEQAREKFVLSMSAVEREITRTLDWREWVRRKPGVALTLAFALGVFIGRRD
jgi:hypothetical protein